MGAESEIGNEEDAGYMGECNQLGARRDRNVRQGTAVNQREQSTGEFEGGIEAAERFAVRSVSKGTFQFPFRQAQPERNKLGPKRAGVLKDHHVDLVLRHISLHSNSPASDTVKFMLSCKGGLRASEIALLRRTHFTDVEGRVGKTMMVYSSKTRRSREIPINPKLKDALEVLIAQHPDVQHVAFSARHGKVRLQNAKAITVWFLRLYREVGLANCSGHSGRRTFGTELARRCNLHHSSIADVQRFMGHRQLSSTECYIELSDNAEELVLAL